MALENGSHIPELDDTNPPGSDPKSQGDDHLRLIKRCVLGSFPAFVGTVATPKAVTKTEDEINDLGGLSADEIITGAWAVFNDVYFSGQNAAADALIGLIKLDTNDNPTFGDATANAILLALAKITIDIGGAPIINVTEAVNGSADIADRAGQPHLIGFRNPPQRIITGSSAVAQGDENAVIRYTGAGGHVLSCPVLELNTTLTIKNPTNNTLTVTQDATVITLFEGGSVATGDIVMPPGSLMQIHYAGTAAIDAWGNV